MKSSLHQFIVVLFASVSMSFVVIASPEQRITPTASPIAYVKPDADGLRLRTAPHNDAGTRALLARDTVLKVLARTPQTDWVQVQTPTGQQGWVATRYVNLMLPPTHIAVVEMPTPQPETQVLSGITERTRDIFRQGQQMGNRADVFSKVGDSITVATFVFYPIGWGDYDLAGYQHLGATVRYFSRRPARDDANSFANVSLAAENGWTTEDVLDPQQTLNPDLCQPDEPPLVCEYRVVKPAFALVMLGTNDVEVLDADTYATNLERIVEISVNRGVVPVLSTIPERIGFPVATFNTIIRDTASAHDIPLWDYYGALADAPNSGLSEDGVHPSYPDETDFAASADFRPAHLEYGYVIRNLTALQVLHQLRLEVP